LAVTAATIIRWRGREWEIEPTCLEERWWSWTEYGNGYWLELPRGPEWISRPLATHAVVTLGYHDLELGPTQLMWATADLRLHIGSAMSLFPILEQTPEELADAADLRRRVIDHYAKEPALL
jgi:hypothetical protein